MNTSFSSEKSSAEIMGAVLSSYLTDVDDRLPDEIYFVTTQSLTGRNSYRITPSLSSARIFAQSRHDTKIFKASVEWTEVNPDAL
jgi:hypothetical protein